MWKIDVIEEDGKPKRGEGCWRALSTRTQPGNGRRLEERDTLGRQDGEDAIRQQPTLGSDEVVSLRQDLRDPNGMGIQNIRATEMTGDDWT